MADIKKALTLLWELEHNSKPEKVLHVNKGEKGYTFFGIYQGAHPNLELWNIVRQKLQQYNGDTALAGSILFDNPRVQELVENFYKREFWDRLKLDKVDSQHIANEMFIFGVNVGVPRAILVTQHTVGVLQDGILGPKTLSAITSFNETMFSDTFDILEKDYYLRLVESKPEKMMYLNGWRNRAEFV